MSSHCRIGLPAVGRGIRRALRAVTTVALGAVLGLVLAGCGGSGGSLTHPKGANEAVLQITIGGGLVPVEHNLTLLPVFSLYGQGRVIVPGPVIAIYPGPALPNLQTAVLSEKAVQAILAAARNTRLFDPDFDYGQPPVADAATTSIVIDAGGATNHSDIYALGMEEGEGLSAEQQRARADIAKFVASLIDLTAFETSPLAWEPYQYTALAVYSTLTDPNAPEPDVQPNRLTWPLDDLSSLGEPVSPAGFRRFVAAGQDLEALEPLLSQATQITLWESGGEEYHLFFRPLLPEETA